MAYNSAAKVKCPVTGKRGYKDEFFLGEDGRYYYNEDTYYDYMHYKKFKGKCIAKLAVDILDYRILGLHVRLLPEDERHLKYTGKEFNTVIVREIDRLAKQYDLEDVYDSIIAQEDTIKDILLKKMFTSEFGKIRYVLTIIENHIPVIIAAKEKQKHLERIREMRETRLQNDNVEADVSIGEKEVDREVKDISNFLD